VRVSISVAGAALAVMAGAPLTNAQELLTYDVAWERAAGAESCPDRAQFVAALEDRVIANRLQAGSPRKLDVRLSRTPREWHAELRVIERGAVKGSQALELRGAACSGLFTALVAIAAVKLGEAPPEPARASAEPEAETAEASPAEPVEPAPRPEYTAASPRNDETEPTVYERPERPLNVRWPRGVLSLEFAQDLVASAPDVDNRSDSGPLVGNWRLLAGLEFGFSERVSFELQGGRAFGEHGPDFKPWHVELNLRYYLLASESKRWRGYVAAGIGLTDFDSEYEVANQEPAYQRLGPGFVTASIGVVWTFEEGHAFTFAFSTNYTFPDEGLVLQPALGYGVEL
jgi:hypothetical protein